MEHKNIHKIEVNCVMKFPIKNVWPIFKDSEEMNKAIKDFKPKILYLNGKKTYEKGCEYKFILHNRIEILSKCIDIKESENYNYIKTYCHLIQPINLIFDNKFYVYADTINNTTFIKWEQIYKNLDIHKNNKNIVYESILNEGKKDMKLQLEIINSYLKLKLLVKHQEESIILNKSRSIIWNIITDFRELIKLVPSVADSAEYEGDPYIIGTNVKLKWNEKKVTFFLKVRSIDKREESDDWNYSLECYDGTPKVSLQTLKFYFRKIDENSCYFKFKHSFTSQLKNEYIKLISEQKKNILLTLSDSLSKF